MRLVSPPTWLTPSASVLWAPRHASCSPSGTFSLLCSSSPQGEFTDMLQPLPGHQPSLRSQKPSLLCPPQCCHGPHSPPQLSPSGHLPLLISLGPPSHPSLDPELCRPQLAMDCQVLGDLRSCAAPGLGVQLLPCLSSAGDRTSPPDRVLSPSSWPRCQCRCGNGLYFDTEVRAGRDCSIVGSHSALAFFVILGSLLKGGLSFPVK